MQSARAAGATGLANALQQQISGVVAQEAGAGSDLQLLAPAAVPRSPSSPQPTRNAFFAFVAVLFIGVLAVGARELVTPTVSGGRELSALMGMPILARVPRVANGQPVRRTTTDTAEAEAYRFLSKSLELSGWPNRPCLVAVTSAVRGEGKTTVVSRLGEAFAETGSRTLLVSADLRWPALDGVFGLPSREGLSGVLSSPNGNRGATIEPSHIERVGENLYVLPSGPPPAERAAVLTNDVVRSLFDRLRRLNFAYVLFDLPPLLAVAETQLFVRYADAVMLVSMVGRANAEQLSQTRELLDRLPARPAGIVVLGVRAGGRYAARDTRQIVATPADRASREKDEAFSPARSREPTRPASRLEPPPPARSSEPMPTRSRLQPPPRPISSDPTRPASRLEPPPPPISSDPTRPASRPEPQPPATASEPTPRAASRRVRQKAAVTEPPPTVPSSEPTQPAPPRRTRQKGGVSTQSLPAPSPEPTRRASSARTRQKAAPSQPSPPAAASGPSRQATPPEPSRPAADRQPGAEASTPEPAPPAAPREPGEEASTSEPPRPR